MNSRGVLKWFALLLQQGWARAIHNDDYVVLPKMVARQVQKNDEEFGRRRRKLLYSGRDLQESGSSSIQSNFAVFTGYCLPQESFFEFPLSSGSGKGMAIVMGEEGSAMNETPLIIQLTDTTSMGRAILEVDMETHSDPMSFGLGDSVSDDPYSWGTRFYFQEIGNNGTVAQVVCPFNPDGTLLDVVVFVRDDSDLMVHAEVSDLGSDLDKRVMRVELQQNIVTKGSIHAKIPAPKGGKMRDHGRRKLEEGMSTLSVIEQTETGIAFELNSQEHGTQLKEKVFIQLKVQGGSGQSIYRTLVTEVSPVQEKSLLPDIYIQPLEITDVGDILVPISGLEVLTNVDNVHLEIRVGLAFADEITSIVDLYAIVPVVETNLILHSGWIRRALAEMKTVAQEQWDLAIVSVEATDLWDSSKILASSSTVQIPGFSESFARYKFAESYGSRKLLRHDHTHESLARELLNNRPSPEEVIITLDMRQGRRPESMMEDTRRLAPLNRKKILVHGYCGTVSPFPAAHFTDALPFSDPDEYKSKSNWSNDEFARKLNQFAQNNKVDSCACIGHSQGGFACLHLKAYYWSCLDNASAGGTRLLQSIGTPYHGTALAGQLAAIGEVFGGSCGYNSDLTYDGAKDRLANIPPDIQAKMYYYTTSFVNTKSWWRNDYCQSLTDILLRDPDDGVTEKWSGELPYGNSAGHFDGECHTANMKYDPQAQDYNRNQEMNSKAMY